MIDKYELLDYELITDDEPEQDLHPIFETELDTFKNVKSPVVYGHMTLWDALKKIQYNFCQDITPVAIYTHKYKEGKKNIEYDEIKVNLPTVCYNATFDGYKDLKRVTNINNIMFLDIDDFPNREEAIQYKHEIIKKYDWIIACNLSLSRLGLHIIIQVDKIYKNKDFNRKYDYISRTYFDGKLDKQSKDLTRFTVLPYDHDIYINYYPSILPIDSILKEKSANSLYIHNRITLKESANSLYIHKDSDLQESANGLYIHEDVSSEKSANSVYNSLGGEKRIYTNCTFSNPLNLKNYFNPEIEDTGLRFNLRVNDELIEDPNIPKYIMEGIEAMEVNIFPLLKAGIPVGRRNITLSNITVKMIYINYVFPDNPLPDVREQLLKYITWVNYNLCVEPLPYDELITLYNAKWKRIREGKIDFNQFSTIQRAFWSDKTTLKGKEKTKATLKERGKIIRQENKKKVREAIDSITEREKELTYDAIKAEIIAAGDSLSIRTIKTYCKDNFDVEIKEYKQNMKKKVSNEEEVIMTSSIEQTNSSIEEDVSNDEIVEKLNTLSRKINNAIDAPIALEDIEGMDVIQSTLTGSSKAIRQTEREVFERVYERSLKRLSDIESKKLYEWFIDKLNNMPSEQKDILTLDPAHINDWDIIMKQMSMDSTLLELVNKIYTI